MWAMCLRDVQGTFSSVFCVKNIIKHDASDRIASMPPTTNWIALHFVHVHTERVCVCQALRPCKNAERALCIICICWSPKLHYELYKRIHYLYSATLNFLIIFSWNIIMRSRLCHRCHRAYQIYMYIEKVYIRVMLIQPPTIRLYGSQHCNVLRNFSRKADYDRHDGKRYYRMVFLWCHLGNVSWLCFLAANHFIRTIAYTK